MRAIVVLLASRLAAAQVSGMVTDPAGAPVPKAQVRLHDAGGAVWHQGTTGGDGSFALEGVKSGHYSLTAVAQGFEPARLAVRAPFEGLRVTLSIAPVSTALTVTASRGMVEDSGESAQMASSLAIPSAPPLGATGLVLGSAAGVMAQQTTPGQASPYLRGLTGYQTLILVDGVRYNTSTFRSGPNQYMGFVTADQVQRIEAVLGPAGASFGSDALGGAIQMVTPETGFASQPGWWTHGSVNLSGATGDFDGGGRAQLSVANERFAVLGGVSARKYNELASGAGQDSHHVFTRFFGLSATAVRDLAGSSLRDTAYSQWGMHLKGSARLSESQRLSATWLKSSMDGVRSYRELWGGLGRTISDVRPQTLDLAVLRYDRLEPGPLDSLAATVSWNEQEDGSLRKGQKAGDPLTDDWSRVRALGASGQAAAHAGRGHVLVFGGEVYDERIRSTRFEGGVAKRAQYPDGSMYRIGGVFGQATAEWGRWRLLGGLRWTGVQYAAAGLSARSFTDTTYHGSVSLKLNQRLAWHLVSGRGFRAPNLNDLGSVGLTGLGYEVPAEEAPGALVAVDASEGSLSRGIAVQPLRPEKLYNVESGFRWHWGRWRAASQYFIAELSDAIVRRTLLFPASAAPLMLGGQTVTPLAPTAAQKAQGVVAVATPVDARAVKAFENDGRSRYQGMEAKAEGPLTDRWTLRGHYSFLAGRDLDPNRPVRRLPPQAGGLALRYVPTGRRPWLEVSAMAAGAQERWNAGDYDDERIGASRRRRDIADFFGSEMAKPWIQNGKFTPTDETLLQIQNRVLPGVGDTTRVPLYTRTPGWIDFSIQGGFPLSERLKVSAGMTNLLDRNYRVHGSGVDSMGRSAFVGLQYDF
jgi:outer membrane receptor protein involved in Fe transport